MSRRAASIVAILAAALAGMAMGCLSDPALEGAKLTADLNDQRGWERTNDGWRRSAPNMPLPRFDDGLHPVVIAAGQLALSLLALVAFPSDVLPPWKAVGRSGMISDASGTPPGSCA